MARWLQIAPLVALAPLAALFPAAAPRAQEAVPAAEQEAPPKPAKPGFEATFPQDTLFFLGIDDLPQLQRDWEASAWGRLFADPKAEPVRAAYRALLEALAGESKKEIGIDLVETAGLLEGRVGVALSGSPSELGAGGGGPDSLGAQIGTLHGVVATDAGEHAGELKSRVARCFNDLVESEKAVMKLEVAGDAEFVSVTPKDPEDKGRIQLAAVGETLALGFGGSGDAAVDGFRRFLAALAGEGQETLAQSPAFHGTLASQPGGIKLWFDTGRLLREGMAEAGDEDSEAAMMRLIGMDQFGALSARSSIDAREMRIEAHQGWSGGWLPKILDAWFVGGDCSLFKLVPADASTALSLHLDLATGFDVTEAARKELGAPPIFGGEAADPSQPADQQPSDPKKDFLDHLDGRVAFFSAAADDVVNYPIPVFEDGVPMNFALMLGVKNAEALRASVDKELRQQGLHAVRKRTEFEGFEIFSMSVMVTVHYAITPDFVVVSPSLTLLQDTLRRKANQELPNLASSAPFKTQLEAMTRSHALLFWSKPSADLVSGAAGAASGGMGATDDFGGFGQEPPAATTEGDLVQERLAALVTALEAFDPAVMLEHLPSGSLLGIAIDPTGADLEGVSR